MSQPIYRYPDTADLLDGALFAFAHSTDPSVLMLFEARRGTSGHRWHYAIARMSSYALEVRRKDQHVWKAPFVAANQLLKQPSQPYFFAIHIHSDGKVDRSR